MLLTWHFALLLYIWEIIMPVVSFEMFLLLLGQVFDAVTTTIDCSIQICKD